jgi:hypothetical protein
LKTLVRKYFQSIAFLVIALVLLFASCRKMESDQTVPAYLKIDSVYLKTFYPTQGSPSSKITNIWVYVDGTVIGVFELPAMFPALYAGKHKLEIRPAVKQNGISSTIIPYPFYKPIIFEDFNFYPDSVINMGALKTMYYDNAKFAWIEDFESPTLSIIESDNSDTTIRRTYPAYNPEAYLSENSRYSGEIVITKEKPFFLGYSFNEYDLPRDGTPVFMEINFKTQYPLLIGLFVDDPVDYNWVDMIYLKETDEWNKLYINVGPYVSMYPSAYGFKIYFSANLNDGSESAKIFIDNIKLIHRLQ